MCCCLFFSRRVWLFYSCCLHSAFILGPQETQQGASKKCSREVHQLQILWRGEEDLRTDRQTFMSLEFMENLKWMFFFHCNNMCVSSILCPVTSSCDFSKCFKSDVDRSETRGAEIRLDKLVWEGAAGTSVPVWHWEIYKQTCLYTTVKIQLLSSPPISSVQLCNCIVKSHIPLINTCITVTLFKTNKKKKRWVTQSMMNKWTRPSVCFMRKKKPYLNLMTHRVKRTLQKRCSNTAFINLVKYNNPHICGVTFLSVSQFRLLDLKLQSALRQFFLHVSIKHLVSFTVCHRTNSFHLVYILLFYLCFLLLAFVSGHHHSHHPVSVGGSSFPMSTMLTHNHTHSTTTHLWEYTVTIKANIYLCIYNAEV